MPMTPPISASTSASTRNWVSTWRFERADGEADADLARALGDRDQHDVHDADAADQQADRRDRAQEAGQQRRCRGHGRDDLAHVAHREIVILVRSRRGAFAQDPLDVGRDLR